MKKILILMLFINILCIPSAQGVPAAPSPTCEITAKILNIEKVETKTAPIMMPSRDVEFYRLTLDILNVSTYQQEGDATCQDRYGTGPNRNQFKIMMKEYEQISHSLNSGQTIKGKVRFRGDERFHGHFISGVEIVKELSQGAAGEGGGLWNVERPPVDYDALRKDCKGNGCCQASVKSMKSAKGFLHTDGSTCPSGYKRNMLKCIQTYMWCQPE